MKHICEVAIRLSLHRPSLNSRRLRKLLLVLNMNRLVLLGNGFDLAHGLKTGYNDFIIWYLKQCYLDAYENFGYSDDLIKIERTSSAPRFNAHDIITSVIDECYKEDTFQDLMENKCFNSLYDQFGSSYSGYFIIDVRSPFLRILMGNCSVNNWVDIENEFYEQLKTILKQNQKKKELLLKNLNESLRAIIDKLEEYLASLPAPNYNERYMDILTSPILESEVYNTDEFIQSEPETTTILNFNYTSTISQYLGWFNQNSIRPVPKVNFIHGRLNDMENPVVFGFGDELDDDYSVIEREKVKGYFEYIKSFWYFRTSNYRDVVTFIEVMPYQIFILGHSCGLSDRTMLNMIFEHDNCRSIKIFYHGDNDKNNFVAITHEIARHFKNKAVMRKKIVSLDKSQSMPQSV